MDPLTLIIAAVVAGLSSGLTETAKTAVSDAYQAFKARLAQLTHQNADAQKAIVELEQHPQSEGRKLTAKEEFEKLKLDQDEALIRLAQTFMEKFDEQGAQAGKYQTIVQNSQGTNIGDHNTITQTFTNTTSSPKKKRS